MGFTTHYMSLSKSQTILIESQILRWCKMGQLYEANGAVLIYTKRVCLSV